MWDAIYVSSKGVFSHDNVCSTQCQRQSVLKSSRSEARSAQRSEFIISSRAQQNKYSSRLYLPFPRSPSRGPAIYVFLIYVIV